MLFRDELEEGGAMSREDVDAAVAERRAELMAEAEKDLDRANSKHSARCRPLACCRMPLLCLSPLYCETCFLEDGHSGQCCQATEYKGLEQDWSMQGCLLRCCAVL